MTSKPTLTDPPRVERSATLRWVPIRDMRVSALGQRELNTARVNRIAADFNPEQLSTPTVSYRGAHFYIIDGQHRVEAMKVVGWEDQAIQCWAYTNLTESDEAEMFLRLNDILTVNAYAKYKIGVQAGRAEETDIERILHDLGLMVTQASTAEGAIQAVGTLRRVYHREGPEVLSRSLSIIRDAYGTPGLQAAVIDGVGYVCGRYNGDINVETTVARLAAAHGGVGGLMNKANVVYKQTGNAKGQCVAAAVVGILNAGRSGSKLPSWWRDAA